MYLFDPQHLLDRAVRGGFITQQQADSKYFQRSAKSIAMEWTSDWSEGEGFGSSDMTFAVKDFLDNLGYTTDFVDGMLTIIDKDAEILPKNILKRKRGAEKLLGYPLNLHYCKFVFEHYHEKEGQGGNTIGDMLDRGVIGNLTRRQHTQIGDAAIDIGRFYTSL